MNDKLQTAKDEIAKEYGYESFEQFDDKSTFGYDHRTPEIIQRIAERYHALMSEWTSVDERLPEFGDRILCIDDGVVQIANYENNPNISRNKYFFLDEQDEQSSFWMPTHWKPLPQPPKQ